MKRMLAVTFFFAVVGCRSEKSSDATTVGTGVQIGPQGSVNVLVPAAGVKVAPGVVEVNGPSGQAKVGVGGVQVNGPGGQAVKVGPQGVTVVGAGVKEDDDEAKGGEVGAAMTTCKKGGCRLSCAAGKACGATCSGGGCVYACEKDATCTFTCSGGGCTEDCRAGSKCSITCSGGGCTQKCAGPCSKTCSGQGCS